MARTQTFGVVFLPLASIALAVLFATGHIDDVPKYDNLKGYLTAIAFIVLMRVGFDAYVYKRPDIEEAVREVKSELPADATRRRRFVRQIRVSSTVLSAVLFAAMCLYAYSLSKSK